MLDRRRCVERGCMFFELVLGGFFWSDICGGVNNTGRELFHCSDRCSCHMYECVYYGILHAQPMHTTVHNTGTVVISIGIAEQKTPGKWICTARCTAWLCARL